MKDKLGIPINLDMANASLMQGKAADILSGGDDDYVTRIIMILPLAPQDIYPGDYQVDHHTRKLDIRLQIISNAQDDPIMRLGQNSHFGTPGTGVPMLPFRGQKETFFSKYVIDSQTTPTPSLMQSSDLSSLTERTHR